MTKKKYKLPIQKKENNLIIHFADELPQNLEAKFKAVVSDNCRTLTACNHTATHLMHEALRTILGAHVEQKGSLVNLDYLRFDFSHFEKVNDEQLKQIEDFVNDKIQANIPLNEHREIPIAMAEEAGAMMLFGEKYGDVVRMIEFGSSKELCGGIHVENTSDIQLFKIKSEGSVAAGIRRVEALTNEGAKDFIRGKIESVESTICALEGIEGVDESMTILSDLKLKFQKELGENYTASVELELKSEKEKFVSATSSISKLKEGALVKQKIAELQKAKAKADEAGAKEKVGEFKEQLLEQIEDIDGVNVIAQKINLGDSGAIKDLAFQLKGQVDNLFLVLGAEVKGKPNLTIAISENLANNKQLHAGNIIREAAKEMRGGGGGQPFFATAGGSYIEGIDAAIEKAKSFLN